ncbi:hypothetical protein GGI35DRAFT_381848 [Trichoderma velutinum]
MDEMRGFHFFGFLCFFLYFNSFKIGFMYLYAASPNHDQSCRILTGIFFYLAFFLSLSRYKIQWACIKHLLMSPTLLLAFGQRIAEIVFQDMHYLILPCPTTKQKLYPYPNPQ